MYDPDDRTHLAPRHRARFGYPLPPVAGGAGDVVEDPPGDTPPAGIPEGVTPPELPFSLDEIENEEHRQFLRAREAQMQAGFSKKINEYRGEVQPLLELQTRLSGDDEAAKIAALNELLAPYGFEIPVEDAESTPPAEATPPPEESATAALEARLAELEAFRANADASTAQRQQAEAEQAFLTDVAGKIAALAPDMVGKPDAKAEQVPKELSDAVVSRALAMNRAPGGFLDIEAAWDVEKAYRAQIVQEARASYLASKDVPGLDLSGGDADPKVDLTDTRTRLDRAVAVAGRHL